MGVFFCCNCILKDPPKMSFETSIKITSRGYFYFWGYFLPPEVPSKESLKRFLESPNVCPVWTGNNEFLKNERKLTDINGGPATKWWKKKKLPSSHEDGNGEKLTVKKWWLFECRFFTVYAEFFTVYKGRKRWKKHLVIDMIFFTVSFSRFTPSRSSDN